MMIRRPPVTRSRLPFICGWILFGGLVGCAPNTGHVTGTVAFEGQLITSGSVILYCEDKQIVRGTIGADGKYSIPNVPLGRAVVTVLTHKPIPAGFQTRQQLPPATDGPILPTTVLGSQDAKIIIPERYGLPEESGLSVIVDGEQVDYPIIIKP